MHTFVGLLQLHHVAKCSSRATHSLCLRGLLRPRRFCDRLGQGLDAGLIHRLFDPTSQSGRGWGDTVRAVRTDPSVRRRLRLCHGGGVAGDAVGVTGAVLGGLGGVTGTRSSFWGSFHRASGHFLSGAAVLAGLPGAVLGGLGCTLLPGAGGAGGDTKLLLRL